MVLRKSKPQISVSQPSFLGSPILFDEDDDFQIAPFTQTSQRKPLRPSNNGTPQPPLKKPKRSVNPGKENLDPGSAFSQKSKIHDSLENQSHCGKQSPGLDDLDAENFSLDFIESSIACTHKVHESHSLSVESINKYDKEEGLLKVNEGYLCNSGEARLMGSRMDTGFDFAANGVSREDGELEENTELGVLLKLCSEVEERAGEFRDGGLIQCPLCGLDISAICEEQRQIHTNNCLDAEEKQANEQVVSSNGRGASHFSEDLDSILSPQKAVDTFPVLKWLRNIGLARYEGAFVREEIDWDTLQWLTEEDLVNIGVTALGPRKKIVRALSELRKDSASVIEAHGELILRRTDTAENSIVRVDEISKPTANKLITDFFPGLISDRKKICTNLNRRPVAGNCQPDAVGKRKVKNYIRNGRLRDIPPWCCIPGTPFRVDAFKYLRGDCSHWFLTHFHMDHYQGLTSSFCHGKIYCSSITARLVNMKIGIPWDRLEVLPLNHKIRIAGIDVTCLDANHCPGSILILFEPPNGKPVLHTGDFRYCEKMASMLHECHIHTLILDTTYCNPQYDFPKKEAVIQFVIEAIQAEAFNSKTLFLIGSYTIGKERLFLEVARVLRKKVYITGTKLRVLECLEFPKEDMQWFTINEQESHIHVVPMWTVASFKRLKHISNQYADRFSLIVAFSPSGWTFSKGKKKSPGRRWQQGTVIRYEVPYSEHCSFTELKEFVKLFSPERIIPSVNNDGSDSVNAMVSLLLS